LTLPLYVFLQHHGDNIDTQHRTLQGTAWRSDFVGVNNIFTPHPVTIMRARSGGPVAALGWLVGCPSAPYQHYECRRSRERFSCIPLYQHAPVGRIASSHALLSRWQAGKTTGVHASRKRSLLNVQNALSSSADWLRRPTPLKVSVSRFEHSSG
jgi:hypothetical protein